MAEAEDKTGLIEPIIEELRIAGKLTGAVDTIAKRLSTLEPFYIKADKDTVTVLRIDSYDIHKRPFLFFIIELGSTEMHIQYSIAHDSSTKMRRLYVIKCLVSIVSLIADLYEPDNAALFQHIDSAIDDLISSLPPTYSTLYNSYEATNNEYREIRKQNIELAASNKNLTVQATRLSEENKELKGRLAELETYSDEALMVRVQDWIEAHDDTIDVDEFSKTLKVPLPRVEQILNKMVSSGYIEAKG